MKLYSPFDTLRSSQEELAHFIGESIRNKQNCIAHAPTGLGKTAAVLAAVLPIAEEEDCTILFLTSRHTQHAIVRETAQMIKEKHLPKLTCTSIYGKKHLCAQEGAQLMQSNDFYSYCKHLRTNGTCSYFTQYKNRTPQHMILLEELQQYTAPAPEIILQASKEKGSCPYETALERAKKSRIIVADYGYAFSKPIREALLKRLGKQLDKIIIIVDEAHNLPSRLKDMLSRNITTNTIKRALKEAKERQPSAIPHIITFQDALNTKTGTLNNGEEALVPQELFEEIYGSEENIQEAIDELEELAERIREEKRSSSAGSIAEFLQLWQAYDGPGFARIITITNSMIGPITKITMSSLDPAPPIQEVLLDVRGIVLMSGTLTPLPFYKNIFGLPPETPTRSFKSPFPEENRLVLIIPTTTTKYTQRTIKQYKAIGTQCTNICNNIPGNVAIYFPSYALRDSIRPHIQTTTREYYTEQKGMMPEEKTELLKKLSSKKNGILLGVAMGSFGEGVDLPGVLSAVIIVGLPLDRPDLETQQTIAYYDKSYGKGWEYGYTLPALTRTFQNAGRCIRTEKDKGALIFIDERFIQPQYYDTFPEEWKKQTTIMPEKELKRFFEK